MKSSNMITWILIGLSFKFWNVWRNLSGDGGPWLVVMHRVIHLSQQIWQIKSGQKRESGLWCLSLYSWERSVLRGCRPSRVLVYTMALSGRVISSSKLIHKRLYGHHTCRSGIMRVINNAPNQRSSGLGVSHSVKLTSFGWNSRGKRGIFHNKCVFQNQHGGRRGKGWNMGSNMFS